jgi:hypothetical protein
MPSDRRFSIAIAASPRALPEARKREGVPTATVFPCPSDLKTDLVEKASNALVCELVTILGVNGFAWQEVKIKVRVLDTYILLLRALEVHLDPRLNGIPKHAMTKASGVKVGPRLLQTWIVLHQNSIFLSPRLALRLFLDLQSGRVLPFYANGPSLARMIGRYSATVG